MKWYKIIPSGPVAIGNLTPVGQNSGQVGCRWPPNGHQIAACIDLPTNCQIWGPFWGFGNDLYLPLPLPVYTTDVERSERGIPKNLYRLRWREEQWQTRSEHRDKEIEIVGGRYLIPANTLKDFWARGESKDPPLESLPWETLTLAHNRREEYRVVEEGGFFAEMSTLMKPGWSIAIRILGDYTPPKWGILGAGTPVVIQPLTRQWDWLGEEKPGANGAILLTGALWQKGREKRSIPYPFAVTAHAADRGIPWQSWKKVRDRHDPGRRVTVLTPGEWLTPAGAVYLGEKGIFGDRSGPWRDEFHRHALGYGHLWLFEEEIIL